MDVQLHMCPRRLVSCRTRHLSLQFLDVYLVDCIFDQVGRTLFGSGLAVFIPVSTKSLEVTLDNHWLEWLDLLLILSLSNVGRWTRDTDVLGLVLRNRLSFLALSLDRVILEQRLVLLLI
jgi:hypothetical protein